MRVYVYYNLHKHLFSVRAEEGPNKGRVIAHKHELTLKNATFHVGEKARQKVIATRCKSVHAGVRGTYEEAQDFSTIPTSVVPVGYNPYLSGYFVDRRNQRPVLGAERAHFSGRTVMVDKPQYMEET